jgi:branched-chain amino acid transport system substrate-binding protein
MRLMVRLGTLLIRRLAPAGVCALAISACGSTQKPASTTATTTTTPGKGSSTVAIYSSLPESGADAAKSRQIETGIRLALHQAHYKAGKFKIAYKPLCDSAAPRKRSHAPTSRGKISTGARTDTRKCSGSWNQTAVVENAEKAASNRQTVAYIGDLNSGATALSLPILNQAGVVQITPGSGYPGLTNSVTVKAPKGLTITQPITEPDEPGKYYPQGLDNRTLLRMIPNDLVQASAALYVLQKAGCQKLSAWNFGNDAESKSLLTALIATAVLKYKMDYVPPPAMPAKTSALTYVTQLVAPTGIRCAVLDGHVTKAAESLTLYLREHLSPAPTIVGTSGFCNRDWLQGIPSVDRKVVAAELYCTTPARPVTVKEYDGAAKFIALFRRAHHRQPTAYNLYGYVATVMLLRALKQPVSGEDDRQQVLTDMVDDTAPNAVDTTPGQVTAFSFDQYGNLESTDYGIDDFKRGGPHHDETVDVIDPTYLLSSAG